MIRRPPRSTQGVSSAASDVYKRQKPLRALRIPRRVVLRSGSTFHGETALRLPPSQKEGVALLVARSTCNEVVPAHKEFLRARQTPVPLICVVCRVLACAAPGTRYAFLFFLFSSSGGWVKLRLELRHFHVCIRYMSCFDSTHAPVATAARTALTGLVSMSTRPDIPGMLHVEREARDWSTCNEYSYRIILLLLLYVYCSCAHPHFPSQVRRRGLQDFFYL